ncbi:MAG: AI-2E family transporter [Oscillospiraceae bacterium]|nr:AI-2E family transporter [Oscillospiraceae bacterium]
MKLHRNEKFFKWGLTVFLAFVACALFWIIFSNLSGFYDLIMKFFGIISPILYGCLFAYFMNPVMKATMKLMKKLLAKRKKPLPEEKAEKLSTAVSVTVSVIVFLLAICALLPLVGQALYNSVAELLPKLEGYYNTIVEKLNGMKLDVEVADWLYEVIEGMLAGLQTWLKELDVLSLLGDVTSSVTSVVVGIFNAIIGIVAAVYILVYKKKLCSQAKKTTVALFNTSHANRIFEISRRTNRIFGNYVIGKLLDALLVGVITYIVMLILGMPYAPLISVIIAVTNIIPFFGPFLGAIPSTLLLLLDKPINAVYFVIFVFVLQMVDGYIIENRILGEKLGISDFWVLTSILAFGGIFGFGGMLLGVPIFAVLYSLISDAIDRRLAKKRYPLPTDIYYTLQCVEDLPVDPAPNYSFASVEPGYDMNVETEDEYEDYDEA